MKRFGFSVSETSLFELTKRDVYENERGFSYFKRQRFALTRFAFILFQLGSRANARWYKTAKNRDVSIGLLPRPSACLLAFLLLACSHVRLLVHLLAHMFACLFTCSLACSLVYVLAHLLPSSWESVIFDVPE